MTDIGSHAGCQGLDRLLAETNKVLADKAKVVVALAGPPGCGKTFMAKHFARFGFGNFSKKNIVIIDDNNIYTTKLWRLRWEKIQPNKKTWQDFANTQSCKILFFSNWIPSRFIDSADIVVNIKVEEHERVARLKRRYPARPDKFSIQQAKTAVPVETPFTCDVMMTYRDPHTETRRWAIGWMIKRMRLCVVGRRANFD